jgi:hypothetical protein
MNDNILSKSDSKKAVKEKPVVSVEEMFNEITDSTMRFYKKIYNKEHFNCIFRPIEKFKEKCKEKI